MSLLTASHVAGQRGLRLCPTGRRILCFAEPVRSPFSLGTSLQECLQKYSSSEMSARSLLRFRCTVTMPLLFCPFFLMASAAPWRKQRQVNFFRTCHQVLIVNHVRRFLDAHSSLCRHPAKCLLSDAPCPSRAASMSAKGGQSVECENYFCKRQ